MQLSLLFQFECKTLPFPYFYFSDVNLDSFESKFWYKGGKGTMSFSDTFGFFLLLEKSTNVINFGLLPL